jgi:hypothetical protein
MQAILVEALMGLFGSFILSLAGLQTILGTRFQANVKWQVFALRIARRESRVIFMAMTGPGPSKTTAAVVDDKTKPFQACPSCGLQGSEEMLREHYLGSPTHLAGKVQGAMEEDEAQWRMPVRVKDPAGQYLFRNMVEDLAPRRAFGLRSNHRKIDPLRGLLRRAILENISTGVSRRD